MSTTAGPGSRGDASGAPGAGGQRHALVTGCSSGIGRAITGHLLAAGWKVTGVSRRRPDFADGAGGATAVPGTAAGPEAEAPASYSPAGTFEWLAADLAEPDALPGLLSGIGSVDAIVHAAGFMKTASLGELDADALRGMFAVHVEAASAAVGALADRITDGGRIVLVGSRTMVGVAGKSHYAATKSAMVGLARSWAIELAPRAITCNVVAPGPTDTPMLADPGRASVPPKVPALGKLVDPQDIAAMVGLLLGPNGGSITGQTITICGGASL